MDGQKFSSPKFIGCGAIPDDDRSSGVAIVLSDRVSKHVLDSGYLSSRVCWVKLKTGFGYNMYIFCIYLPYVGHKIAASCVIDSIYKFARTKTTTRDFLMLKGDLNAKVARNIAGISGPFCIHSSSCSNGILVEELCRKLNLVDV